MAIVLKSSILQPKKYEVNFQTSYPFKNPIVAFRRFTPMASFSTKKTVGLSETFIRLKREGKVALIPYITAGDPDLSTTAEALKVLNSCGADIIELGVPYSDPLADGPVIQAAATRSLARGTNFDAIMSMLKGTKKTVGLSETFIRLKREGKVALIPYITAGDPDLSTTAEALKVLNSCGADIIELGVPYSDPLADGPVIQAAATRSLARGTNFDAIMSMLKEVVPQMSCPIALFTYYNPILRRGIEKFMSTVRSVGVHGLVVPDVPLEETTTLRIEAKKNGIEVVLLTTPTTPTNRMKAIVEASEGFVYLVSSVGVTGTRASVSDKVQALLCEVKEATTKPVAVGFGISKPEHAKLIAGWGADGVIVGSAMVKLLAEAKSPQEGLKELENFTKSLKSALT